MERQVSTGVANKGNGADSSDTRNPTSSVDVSENYLGGRRGYLELWRFGEIRKVTKFGWEMAIDMLIQMGPSPRDENNVQVSKWIKFFFLTRVDFLQSL